MTYDIYYINFLYPILYFLLFVKIYFYCKYGQFNVSLSLRISIYILFIKVKFLFIYYVLINIYYILYTQGDNSIVLIYIF